MENAEGDGAKNAVRVLKGVCRHSRIRWDRNCVLLFDVRSVLDGRRVDRVRGRGSTDVPDISSLRRARPQATGRPARGTRHPGFWQAFQEFNAADPWCDSDRGCGG